MVFHRSAGWVSVSGIFSFTGSSLLKQITSASALPVTLYNPAGRKRRHLLEEALRIFREERGEDLLCAWVKNAGRPQEERWVGRLADFPADDVDMSTLVLMGSARTLYEDGALYEARGYVEKYLDDAYLAHLPQVRVVHGRGTGALKAAVHRQLKKLKYVKEFRLGTFGEGDTGVTIVTFK